jgi:hypothetical protein
MSGGSWALLSETTPSVDSTPSGDNKEREIPGFCLPSWQVPSGLVGAPLGVFPAVSITTKMQIIETFQDWGITSSFFTEF